MVDVRRWQSDLEAARVRDHGELLSLGQRVESENVAINRELAQQGATIAEVLRVIHVRTPPPALSSPAPHNLPAHTRMAVTLSTGHQRRSAECSLCPGDRQDRDAAALALVGHGHSASGCSKDEL